MFKIKGGLFCIALVTLMLELTLVRVFDVIWYSNMAYMVITLAMFCFGLSGIYSSCRPFRAGGDVNRYLAVLAFLFSVFTIAIRPALNAIPFDFNEIYTAPTEGILMFLLMYLILIIPFFLAGLIFTSVFSAYSEKIQSLYFWDLCGAAFGCVLLIPLIPPIGPGGILFVCCGLGLLAAACFANISSWKLYAAVAVALAVICTPFVKDDYFTFKDHISKRGVKKARDKHFVSHSYWDPISKIDVINFGKNLHVAYDGGSQSTYIFPFDGDYDKLRADIEKGRNHGFYNSSVYISHALKKDTNHEALVIGAAGGSETKAALMFGASHVDAVELVAHVVDLGKHKFAQYNGGIYNDPRANVFCGEGRSFLRSTNKKYDVIQMYSNHTSSSIAAGTGAMATTYLQTVEAYKEYFTHLKEDGILHINHHVYPKMITTAAQAWKELGRTDFSKYVVVTAAKSDTFRDNLPTMLIKMTPWTEKELQEVRHYMHGGLAVVVNPLNPSDDMLSPAFFESPFPQKLIDESLYRVAPSTDDRPYFNFLRKSFGKLEVDHDKYLDFSVASLINSQLRKGWIPNDVIHLIVTGGASLFFAVLFIFVPLFFSGVGKAKWTGKGTSLVYFSCLGAGFIIFELTFIQIFMKLVGYPLYTYSTVVFAMLLSAGIGSSLSGKLGVSPQNRWTIPFIGVAFWSVILLLFYQPYFELFLQTNIYIRILAAIVAIFPLGLFLGMPFPLGILTIIEQPRGAIPWAWAMNGLFTVIGGLSSVLLSIYYGFSITLIVAIVIYLGAFISYGRLRRAVLAG